jgi:Hypothetical methyltransferase
MAFLGVQAIGAAGPWGAILHHAAVIATTKPRRQLRVIFDLGCDDARIAERYGALSESRNVMTMDI